MIKMIEGRAVILVIDIQYDFLPRGAFPREGGWDIVPRINRLTEACRRAGIPVIFFQEFHRKTGVDFGRELDGGKPYHCLEDTHGVDIVKELKIEKGEYVIKKPRLSVFLVTGLEYLLNGLGILPGDTLIMVGMDTEVCVHYSAAEASQRDYRVRVVEECCTGRTREEHEAALITIQRIQTGSRVKMEEMLEAIAEYEQGR